LPPTTSCYRYNNFEDMYHDLTQRFAQEQPGFVTSYKSHCIKANGVAIEIDHPSNTLEFRKFGYMPTRWKVFGRRYLDQAFFPFLDFMGPQVDSAESGYYCKTGRDHKHGNCIFGLSYSWSGFGKATPVLTLMSRTAYLQPTSILELTLAGMICDDHFQRFGVRPKLQWHLACLQFSTQWGYPWLLGEPELLSYLLDSKLMSPKNLVNFTRYERDYKRFNEEGIRYSYHRMNRLLERATEVRKKNFTPWYATEWPIQRDVVEVLVNPSESEDDNEDSDD